MFIETEYSDSRKENTRSNDQVDLFPLFHEKFQDEESLPEVSLEGSREKEDEGMVKGEGKHETRERFNFYR